MSSCLQWVDHNYINAIKRLTPDAGSLFDQNKYQAVMFEPSFRWHFTKSELYKHYFLEFARQLQTVSEVTGKERYILVKGMIQHALKTFRAMDDSGVALDPNSDGSHLTHWLTAANGFAKDQGWG